MTQPTRAQRRRAYALAGAKATEIVQTASRSGCSTTAQTREYRLGRSGPVLTAILLSRPVGGRFSSSPAWSVASRIRNALRAPDPMPELRRRLRELRGE